MNQPPTRLLFNNLPPSATSADLRSHLSRCPPFPPSLTDCKVLQRPDGTSRRIAFAGFKDNKEAERVKNWAQGSYLQGSGGGARIGVDWAKDAQDAPRPRKRSKIETPAEGVSAPPAPVVELGPSEAKKVKDDAARFAEFMAVMGPRKGRALEDLTEGMAPSPVPVVAAPTVVVEPKTKPVVEENLIAGEKTTEVPSQAEDEMVVDKDGVADDDTISDMEYMARRMKRKLDVEEEEEAPSSADEHGEKVWDQDEEETGLSKTEPVVVEEAQTMDANEALLRSSRRLFLRNLAYGISEVDLRSLLEPFGELEQVHIPLDPATRSSKGLAYATYVTAESALEAYESLDRRSFQGRLLHLIPAVARDGRPERGDDLSAASKKSGVRNDRELEKKKEAGKSIGWGTLFMNSDAVLTSVAERLQISKAQLLDPSSDNASVRVALAETHVIAETKKYFEDEGVSLTSLTSRGPRSNTTILVKNLPFATTPGVLTALFAPFGTVSRLILPPSGTMAIVEMSDASAANDAWRGLVYKKVGASVLYLEKAPSGIWDGEVAQKPKPVVQDQSTTSVTAPLLKDVVEDSSPAEAGSTLFIKNLSWTTTTKTLGDAFRHLSSYVFARVQTKPDPKKPGETLSMGFGFVGFRDVDGAKAALAARDGFLLDGHKLEVKFAMRGKEEKDGKEESETKKGKGTKLIVKNLPFEATKKDVRELFSAYGQLRSVRLPLKLDRHTRGFAFLDFLTNQDAVSAFGALEHTHLLGRHLVLQWADEGTDEVEELRKRTGYSDRKIGATKSKFRMEDGGRKGVEGGDD